MAQFNDNRNIIITPVVKNLLIINGIFFLATFLFRQNPDLALDGRLAVYYFDSPMFRWWQPLTYMFMHGGIAHILFNMFALYSFGSFIERSMGKWRFVAFYLITGFGALALQFIFQAIELHMITGSIVSNGNFFVNPGTREISFNPALISREQAASIASIYLSPMVGASGAIFGILVAFVILEPNAHLMFLFVPFGIKAKYIVPLYIAIELFLGLAQFSGDPVAHFAHLGGALFGFILMKTWRIKEKHWI